MFQIEATAQCIRLLELLHVTFLCFRLKLQHSVSDQLHGLPISKDWSYNGRPCSPRVLFVFESNPLDVSVEDSELGSKSRSPVCTFFHYEPKQYFQSLIKTFVSCILICIQWKIESYQKKFSVFFTKYALLIFVLREGIYFWPASADTV